MANARCPICGKELPVGLGEEYVGLVAGPELDLRVLAEDEVTYAHLPCGWVILRKRLMVL